jgi:hypothetical protein
MTAVAHTELRAALKMLADPFDAALHHDCPEDLVKSVGDIAPLDLPTAVFIDPRYREALAQLDLKQRIELDSSDRPRWQVFQDAATNASARIDRVLQLYGSYFDPEVLTLVLQLQSSEFLEMRLKRLGEFVRDNDYIERPILFIHLDPKESDRDRFGYERFWGIVDDLDSKLQRHEILFFKTFHEAMNANER